MHEGLAGVTNAVVSMWHDTIVMVPIPLAVKYRKVIHPHGSLWNSVIQSVERPDHDSEAYRAYTAALRRRRLKQLMESKL